MAEFDDHLKAATRNLNRLLATIDDSDQGKLIAALFDNIVDAICVVQTQSASRKAGGNGEDRPAKTVEARTMSPDLEAAVDSGDIEKVKQLLAGGADINAQDQNGCTSLSRSVLRGHTHIAEFLVGAGADVNVRTSNGWTALDIAEHRSSRTVAEFLRTHGGKSGKELT